MLWHQITINEIRFYNSLIWKKKIGGRQWVGEMTVMGETWNAKNVLTGGKSW